MLIDPVLDMLDLASSVHADKREVSLDDGESAHVGQRGEKMHVWFANEGDVRKLNLDIWIFVISNYQL